MLAIGAILWFVPFTHEFMKNFLFLKQSKNKRFIGKSHIKKPKYYIINKECDTNELCRHKKADVANGLGVRVSLFVSGCHHHCKDCFNSEAWDFNYGNKFTEKEEERIMNELDHPYVAGLTLLGGEPLEHVNQQGILPLVKKVKEKFPDKNIWCYTGYEFDKDVMGKMYNEWKETPELLSYIDVMVDGKFEEDKKDIKLRFRGSSNQRIIDVQKSLKEHKVVMYEL